MELSNKSLALLLVSAIVISLGGTLVTLNRVNSGITGFATSAGQVNLTINTSVACNVDSNVIFGLSNKPSGTYSLTSDKDNSLTTTFYNCTDLGGSASNMTCKGLQVNNTGNVHSNISFSSNSNASTLLGAQTGLDITDFRYWVQNGTALANASNGCRNITNGSAQIEGAQLNIIESANQLVCRNFTHDDGSDIMHLEFNITLENDVAPGTKTATATITCEQI